MLTIEQQIFEQVKRAKKILITFSKNWNGDAVASALAMFLFLKKLDKDVHIAAEKYDQSKTYAFLPGYAQIQTMVENLRKFIISLDITNAKVGQVKYVKEENTLNFIISPKEGFFTPADISSRAGGFTYDLVITLGTPDLEALGRIYDNDTEFFYQVPIVNIDHHSGNEEYGQINKVELTAVATAEIVFNLLVAYSRDSIDEPIATCLLAGLISETRSFKTQNITPDALSAASQLIAMGARREEIVNRLYRSRSLSVLKLWGRVLARLMSVSDGKLVWSVLTASDFDKTGAAEDDIAEAIEELIINIPDAKVIVIIYETAIPPDRAPALPSTKAIIYAAKNINSLLLAKEFNPQGTKTLVRLTLDKPLPEGEKELIATIKAKLEKLPL
jgi:bifunctional oligoribonuclease and PAP phosphatase NrnA